MNLMGLPMRYPRFLIVLFVALCLAALPATRAHAAGDDTLSDALEEIQTMTAVAHDAAEGADLARWGGLVDALVEHTGLDRDDVEQLITSAMDLVLVVTTTGERVGVLSAPDSQDLLDAVFALAASVDAHAEHASAKAAYLTERAVEATERALEAERRAMEALADAAPPPVVGPVEQWRPIVERYFDADLVGEALSIITCESNGDPTAINRRSGAAGLFQFIPGTWTHASREAGFSGASPFEPEPSIAAAAWLVAYSLDAGNSAWTHWTCRP